MNRNSGGNDDPRIALLQCQRVQLRSNVALLQQRLAEIDSEIGRVLIGKQPKRKSRAKVVSIASRNRASASAGMIFSDAELEKMARKLETIQPWEELEKEE